MIFAVTQAVSFTLEGAKRIATAVRSEERRNQNTLRGLPNRINRHTVYLGKTDAAIAKGASGTISIYSGTTKGSETDTNLDITSVYNRFSAVAINRWVHVSWVDNGFELSAGEC